MAGRHAPAATLPWSTSVGKNLSQPVFCTGAAMYAKGRKYETGAPFLGLRKRGAIERREEKAAIAYGWSGLSLGLNMYICVRMCTQ